MCVCVCVNGQNERDQGEADNQGGSVAPIEVHYSSLHGPISRPKAVLLWTAASPGPHPSSPPSPQASLPTPTGADRSLDVPSAQGKHSDLRLLHVHTPLRDKAHTHT